MPLGQFDSFVAKNSKRFHVGLLLLTLTLTLTLLTLTLTLTRGGYLRASSPDLARGGRNYNIYF